MINYHDITIFIISFNRLSYLERLVNFLIEKHYTNIHIIDNNSSYQPLLEYLSTVPCTVHRLSNNLGHKAVWECGLFDDIITNQFYVVSDCDILPSDDLPENFIAYFLELLTRNKKITKVGFALKIDDLPDHFNQKKKVIEWESKYWANEIEKDIYYAPIDTTFALYRPGIYPNRKKWWESLRVSGPFLAKHLPWYEDSLNPSEETIQYQNSISFDVSDWTHDNDSNIKEKYIKLLDAYRAERNKNISLKDELEFIKEYYFRIPKFYRLYLIKRYMNKIERKIKKTFMVNH